MVASLDAQAAWEALTRTDDLLAEILIRLPTLADHGRACAAYAVFRRVITSVHFLRRLHTLHPPSLLGLQAFTGRFQPVEPPHPGAPAARALAAAADFRFSFLPNPGFWMPQDARGGRFVLDHVGADGDRIFTTIAVCDPLFQRYVILPPIPDELAAVVDQEGKLVSRHVFLAPCGEEAEVVAADATEKRFMVIWMAQCPTKLVAFVYSSATRQWRPIPSRSWHDMNHATSSVGERCELHSRCYAYGCFYWSLSRSNLVALDTCRMEFFLFDLPSSTGDIRGIRKVFMVESRENSRQVLVIHFTSPELQIFCANRQNNREDATEWVLENEVSLPSSCSYKMLGHADGKLILQTETFTSEPDVHGCISLDIKTLELEKVRRVVTSRQGLPLPSLCIGYPPSLSSPTV